MLQYSVKTGIELRPDLQQKADLLHVLQSNFVLIIVQYLLTFHRFIDKNTADILDNFLAKKYRFT
jgi:hypothetical protein